MSESRPCPYCQNPEPFDYVRRTCSKCGGMMVPESEEVGDEECVWWEKAESTLESGE